MKFLLISLLFLLLPVPILAQEQAENQNAEVRKKLQKFNPIYGSEQEANEIISFISSNLAVELDADQVKGINGNVVCSFVVDTMGNIVDLSIQRSLRPWIDYAILGAMKQLPPWGVASIRRNNKVNKRFNIVFSFGTSISKFSFGYQYDKVTSETQKNVDQQRAAINRELVARKEKWDGFTKDNAKLRYDNRGALRNEQHTLPGTTSPLNPMDAIPPSSPTISISAPKE